MHKLFIAIVVALLAAGPAAATDQSDVMQTVRQFENGFNKADAKLLATQCAEQTSIIDDFPPHEWHGAGTCAKWFAAFQDFAKSGDMIQSVVTIAKPTHLDVTGDVAYVVAPTTIAFKQKEKSVKNRGEITLSLKKEAHGWRITGWAWADH